MKIMICRNRSWMYNYPVRWYTVVDEMSVDEMSVDEMSVDELSWNLSDLLDNEHRVPAVVAVAGLAIGEVVVAVVVVGITAKK